jgi:hypothetical protein
VELVDSLLRIYTNVLTTAALHAVSHERRISTSRVFCPRVFLCGALTTGRLLLCLLVLNDLLRPVSRRCEPAGLLQNMSAVLLSPTSNPQIVSTLSNTYLGHLVSVLPLRADAPHHGCESKHDTHDNSGVGLPVLWLSVPTTGGRPDVLGVPVVVLSSAIGSHHARARNCYTYGTLAPPPMSACVGFIVGVFEVLGGYLPIT